MAHKVISVTVEEKNRLNKVREHFEKEHGIRLSYSKTITFLVNEWEKNINSHDEVWSTQKEDDRPDYIEELLKPSV